MIRLLSEIAKAIVELVVSFCITINVFYDDIADAIEMKIADVADIFRSSEWAERTTVAFTKLISGLISGRRY